MEIALLDKHASVFNSTGLPPAFFAGYGCQPTEPNTSIHRVIQTLEWAMCSDWDEIDNDPQISSELKQRRSVTWRPILLDYVRSLPRHVARLRALIDNTEH